ncbi:MAG: UXX-star selenoprotein family 1 [Deltaproteobacteria bacterium]
MKVLIYGKESCPYTRAARDDYGRRGVAVDYRDVTQDPQALAAMLALTGGGREVPVILDGSEVKVGFGGGT